MSNDTKTLDYYQINCREYFDRTAYIDPRPILSPLISLLPQRAKILDIGCGSGRDLLWLKKHGFSPTGFELCSCLAELARDFSGCSVLEGDFSTYSFERSCYDAVILVGSLVHVPHEEMLSTMKKIIITLKHRGLLLISLKEGNGTSKNSDGRTFYLWQEEMLKEVTNSLKLKNIETSHNVSALNKNESWLNVLLRKDFR